VKFTAVVETAGRTATGFEVPDEVVAGLGGGRRPAVHVTVNGGHHYRSTVTPMGGRFMLPLSAENRTAAGVTGGDQVELELTLDTEPREAVIPDDFAAALAADPQAEAFFGGLSFSNKQSYLQWIASAKTAETRDRRVAQGVELLRGGRAHR
jgi:hypothetical protein